MMELEKHTATLYELGYRQMPLDMQEMVLTGINKNTVNKNPSPFTTIKPKDPRDNEYVTLSGGVFQEVFETKLEEIFGNFIYNTTSKTIIKLTFLFGTPKNSSLKTQNSQLIDPVAFAYDFGARIYDARLGRWLSTDPLQAKYPGMSPYNFVGNSPIMFIDPDGRDIIASIQFLASTNNKAAFEIFISSDIAKKYLEQYASSNGNLLVTSSSGLLSHHNIEFTNKAPNAQGLTTLKYKNADGEFVEYKGGSEISEDVQFEIEIGIDPLLFANSYNEGSNASVINHEIFAHTQGITEILTQWENRKENGMTLEDLKNKLNEWNSSEVTDKEHEDLNSGNNSKYIEVYKEISVNLKEKIDNSSDKKSKKSSSKRSNGFEGGSKDDVPNIEKK